MPTRAYRPNGKDLGRWCTQRRLKLTLCFLVDFSLFVAEVRPDVGLG